MPKKVRDGSKPSSMRYLVVEHRDGIARTKFGREFTPDGFIELVHVSFKVISADVYVDCVKAPPLR
jgi:hypothetical protein